VEQHETALRGAVGLEGCVRSWQGIGREEAWRRRCGMMWKDEGLKNKANLRRKKLQDREKGERGGMVNVFISGR